MGLQSRRVTLDVSKRRRAFDTDDRLCSDNTTRNHRVAMANRFFQKIASEVLEASEKLSARLEDGISAILTGELPASGQPNANVPNRVGQASEEGQASSFSSGGVGDDTADYGSSQGFEETMEMLDGEDAYGGTPLEGIARGVIGDIMANQVRPPTAKRDHPPQPREAAFAHPVIDFAFTIVLST
jgi:hypothetical protein